MLVQKTYGLIGVFLVAPMAAFVMVWRDNIKLRTEANKAKNAEIDAHKLRVKDAQEVNVKLVDVIKEQNAMNSETNIALERIGDAFNAMLMHRVAANTANSGSFPAVPASVPDTGTGDR